MFLLLCFFSAASVSTGCCGCSDYIDHAKAAMYLLGLFACPGQAGMWRKSESSDRIKERLHRLGIAVLGIVLLCVKPIATGITEKMREVLMAFLTSELVVWAHLMISRKVFNEGKVRLFGLRATMLEAKGRTDLLKEFRRGRLGKRKLEHLMGWGLSCLRSPSMASLLQ
jgi:hypothetical protein